jgi:hypothetical protein
MPYCCYRDSLFAEQALTRYTHICSVHCALQVSVWQTAAALQREMDARTAKGAAAAAVAAASHNAAAAAAGTTSSSSSATSSGAKGGPVSPTNGASLSTVTNGQSSSSLLRRAMDVDQARAQPKQLLVGSHSPERGEAAVGSKSPGGPGSPLRAVVPSSAGSLRAEEKGRGRTAAAAASDSGSAAKQVAATAATSSDDSAADADSKDSDPAAAAAATNSASSRLAAAKPLTKTRVALPHHITPMAAGAGSSDLEAKLRKMRADLGSDMGEAPWDEFGRPRGALGKGLK